MAANRSSTTLDDPSIDIQPGTETPGTTHPLADAGSQIGESAGHVAERATTIGLQQADRRRTEAADGIEQVAQSIRRVSTDMEGEQPSIASVAMTAADQVERVSEYLRETDVRQILRTVEDTARRQPLLFIGGAFALGVAVSRLIKAGGGATGRQSANGQQGYGVYDASATGAYRPVSEYEATGPGSTIGHGSDATGGR